MTHLDEHVGDVPVTHGQCLVELARLERQAAQRRVQRRQLTIVRLQFANRRDEQLNALGLQRRTNEAILLHDADEVCV